MRNRRSVVAVVILMLLAVPLGVTAQLTGTVQPTVETAEKGKVFEINLRLEARSAVDSIFVTAFAPENFCIQAVPVADSGMYTVLPDGSVMVPYLGGSSAMTVPFRVQAPTQWRFSKRTCTPLTQAEGQEGSARSLDNTRDSRVFVFNGRYTVRADSSRSAWTASATVKYTTSMTVFLWAGMLGVFLGYLVKSLTARGKEARAFIQDPTEGQSRLRRALAFLFAKNLDKLLTSLVLGFAALLTVQQAGIPVGGAASAVLAGISIGIVADDALISRLS